MNCIEFIMVTVKMQMVWLGFLVRSWEILDLLTLHKTATKFNNFCVKIYERKLHYCQIMASVVIDVDQFKEVCGSIKYCSG